MKKGFTLIELLVVMFIIGLLASLVIVNVNNSRKTARDAKRIANLRSLQGALEQYNDKNGSYPISSGNVGVKVSGVLLSPGVSWGGLCRTYNQSNPPGLTSSGSTGWIPNLAPDFISVLPQDPKGVPASNNQQYTNDLDFHGCYAYASDGKEYKLKANLQMETICGTGPSDACNSTSIREIYDPAAPTSKTVSLYTSGAYLWSE
ncbi:MAG: prepilin-type N-terminal cleavage/methylation domain-containing protein [Patescibacteria group bacterium]|nr:prepilin-type N-terminal cleavage/methylation domain-containing protein [Patescibacteria group bacterium]